ncbi:MAG TPA: Rieske (2Fe-2S) protein [Chloroflexota bacterium]|nr:Rieske (2Fe-2S) protein [Chloroflexota bacterium]
MTIPPGHPRSEADDRSEPGTSTRRALLARVGAGLGAFLAAALGVPVIGAIVSPAGRRDESPWISLGQVADFAVGQPRMVQFGIRRADGYLQTTLPRAVWVYRSTEENVVVRNARCTHLGCLVGYRAESSTFVCPCHGGVFARDDGRVLDGPPPRAMDELRYRIDGGLLMTQYQDFQVGVPNRVAL